MRIKGHTAHETDWALEGPMADVTECIVKELVANEAERAVMRIDAAVTQCAVLELTVDAME